MRNPIPALAGALLLGPLFAQQIPPVRIFRGELVEWEVQGLQGDFALRTQANRIERCRLTSDTFITREIVRVAPVGVRIGDHLEVIGDYRAGASTCTAVTIYLRVYDARRRLGPLPSLTLVNGRHLMDSLFPRGNLTFAGVVRQSGDNRLIVATRTRGHKIFAVRPDTVFRHAGREVEATALENYTRVFVRASLSYDGVLEAHQVIWGQILFPGRQNASTY